MVVLLNPSEQVAYWWIKTYIAKAYEISRSPEYFISSEREFSKVIMSIDELNWRYAFSTLPSRIYSGYRESTDKNGHIEINKELSSILGREIPNINLSERQSKPSVISANPKSVCVTLKREKKNLPRRYEGDYNYILSGDKEGLEFYNLIRVIITNIKKKNKRCDSLNIIRNTFCKKYIEINNLDISLEEITARFNSVIDVLKEHSIIKVEIHGKEETITEWPIDDAIFDEQYSELILNEYNIANNSRVKEYTPPSTREERRRFTGKARERKNKALSETTFDTFMEDEGSIRLDGKTDKTTPIKVLKLRRQIERLPRDIFNEISFYIFEDEITITRDKTNKKDSYNTYKAVFNIESPDFEITVTDEENTYFFKLEKNIITLISGRVRVIIDLDDNSVITKFECEGIDKHSVTLERKITKELRVLEDVVIFDLKNKFASDKFRVKYYSDDKMYNSRIDKYIVHVIENINLWTATSEARERVLEVIRNIKNDLELPALIERVNDCLLELGEKTDESNKGKPQYIKQ